MGVHLFLRQRFAISRVGCRRRQIASHSRRFDRALRIRVRRVLRRCERSRNIVHYAGHRCEHGIEPHALPRERMEGRGVRTHPRQRPGRASKPVRQRIRGRGQGGVGGGSSHESHGGHGNIRPEGTYGQYRRIDGGFDDERGRDRRRALRHGSNHRRLRRSRRVVRLSEGHNVCQDRHAGTRTERVAGDEKVPVRSSVERRSRRMDVRRRGRVRRQFAKGVGTRTERDDRLYATFGIPSTVQYGGRRTHSASGIAHLLRCHVFERETGQTPFFVILTHLFGVSNLDVALQ
mmetsp:Transcript_24624/g.52237  ORF Transcript_24624/g.52237 Transcript_24624/m.52237 type:complete len:290 (+) Transcript_24624:301-1170(+)